MAYNLLRGKRGIIFGALDENSIAWKTALKVKEEGGQFTLTNAPIAMRMGKIKELAAQCNAEIIPADATLEEDLKNLFTKSTEILGGKLDFVLHSIGMSPNVRKDKSYGDLNYDWFQKTLDISGISFHKVLQTAEKNDAMNEWGSIVALTYIAGQRSFPDYSDMAQAKAVLESIARSYGHRFGKLKKSTRQYHFAITDGYNRRRKAFPDSMFFFDYARMMSPLGNASAEDCANYIVLMFSDYSRMVTMQNLMHDGGFSTTGITEELVEKLKQ